MRCAISLSSSTLQMPQHLVVLEVAELPVLLLQVHRGRTAPQAEVGVVGLARPVHAAAHDGDRDLVLLGVARQLLDLLRQLDEFLVLDARARRARDDVQPRAEVRHRDEAAGRDVVDNLVADEDFLVLALVGQRQRDANRVADALREQLLERDPRLDDAVGRQSRLGDAQMQRHVGPALRRSAGWRRSPWPDRNPSATRRSA